jgi:hypothetical protein
MTTQADGSLCADRHPISCQCGGTGYVERGPAGATYSFPCYPWDCKVKGCACHDALADPPEPE